jgi:hypothetical protein
MWIELFRRSIFSRVLAYTSDFIAPDEYRFEYGDRKILVTRGGAIVVGTDGWTFLATDQGVLHVEREWLRMSGLVGAGNRFSVNWVGDQGRSLSIQRLDSTERPYLITRQTSISSILFTGVRLTREGADVSEQDQKIAVAMVAFFWAFFENDRTSS